MQFLLVHADHSRDHQRQLRRWYHANGVLAANLSGPGLVDTVTGTVTVRERVPVDGQQDCDFPELVYGADDQPLAVERIVPLQVMPLAWMLSMTGLWNARALSDHGSAH